VALLNRDAAAWGLRATHFADPSGYSAATVSSARDLVQLGSLAIADPSFAAIVDTAEARLPDGTQLTNLDTLLTSEPGWIGVKTGWTPAAGGCLLFAAAQTYAARAAPLRLVGAVLGQPPLPSADPAHPELGGAFSVARTAALAVFGSYAAVSPADVIPQVTGGVDTRWGADAGLRVVPVPGQVLMLRQGTTLGLASPVLRRLIPPAPAGTEVARLAVQLGAGHLLQWEVVLRGDLPSPPWWWRLRYQ